MARVINELIDSSDLLTSSAVLERLVSMALEKVAGSELTSKLSISARAF